MRKAMLAVVASLAVFASCRTKAPEPAPQPSPEPSPFDYLSRNGIIERFKKETGFTFIDDVKSVEYLQNEFEDGSSIVKFTLFLQERDIDSILAQKPPFSSEWTSSDIYKDYQNEWLNLQKVRNKHYAKLYPKGSYALNPQIEKGFISLVGSLGQSSGRLKMMCVNIDYASIIYYVIYNAEKP